MKLTEKFNTTYKTNEAYLDATQTQKVNSSIKTKTLSFDNTGGNACNTDMTLDAIYDVIIPWKKLKHVTKGDIAFEDGMVITSNGVSDNISKEEVMKEMKIIDDHLKSLGFK